MQNSQEGENGVQGVADPLLRLAGTGQGSGPPVAEALLKPQICFAEPDWSQTPLPAGPGVADPLPGVAGTGQGSGPPSR